MEVVQEDLVALEVVVEVEVAVAAASVEQVLGSSRCWRYRRIWPLGRTWGWWLEVEEVVVAVRH